RPDILLADFLTPTPQLSQELHALTAAFPTARIVVLTLGFQKSQVAEALRFGVRGIVLKNVTADVLFKSIRIVAAGEYWIERDVLADLVHDSAASSTADARRWTRPPRTDRVRPIVRLHLGAISPRQSRHYTPLLGRGVAAPHWLPLLPPEQEGDTDGQRKTDSRRWRLCVRRGLGVAGGSDPGHPRQHVRARRRCARRSGRPGRRLEYRRWWKRRRQRLRRGRLGQQDDLHGRRLQGQHRRRVVELERR